MGKILSTKSSADPLDNPKCLFQMSKREYWAGLEEGRVWNYATQRKTKTVSFRKQTTALI